MSDSFGIVAMMSGDVASHASVMYRIVYSCVGIVIGITGFILWIVTLDYNKQSYATLTFAGLSGVMAVWNLILHVMHLQDLWRTWLKGLRLFVGGGIFFLVITTVAFLTFIIIGADNQQHMTTDSYYVAAIWCIWGAFWAFLLFWHARKYRNEFADLTALLDF